MYPQFFACLALVPLDKTSFPASSYTLIFVPTYPFLTKHTAAESISEKSTEKLYVAVSSAEVKLPSKT